MEDWNWDTIFTDIIGLQSTTVTYLARKAIDLGEKRKIRAITPFKIIQDHPGRYQSKARMRLPISDCCCCRMHLGAIAGQPGNGIIRDCNPGLEFSIPEFGIVEFPIPGSRRDWRTIVKTTKIATWVMVFDIF